MPEHDTYEHCRGLMSEGWHNASCGYCENPTPPPGWHGRAGSEWEWGIDDAERALRRKLRLSGEIAAIEQLLERLRDVHRVCGRRAEIALIPIKSGAAYEQSVLAYQTRLQKDIALGAVFAVSTVISMGTGSMLTGWLATVWTAAAESRAIAVAASMGLRMAAGSVAQKAGTRVLAGESNTVLARGIELAKTWYEKSLGEQVGRCVESNRLLGRMILVANPEDYYDIAIEVAKLGREQVRRRMPGEAAEDIDFAGHWEVSRIWSQTEREAQLAIWRAEGMLRGLTQLLERLRAQGGGAAPAGSH